MSSRFISWRRSAALLLCSLALHAVAQTPPAASTDPRGRWLVASGNLEVDIAPCGAALCGTVTKVLAERSMSREGEPMKPVDPRPALGMKILIDFEADDRDAAVPSDGSQPTAPKRWSGQIYNRENGKTYRCHMSLNPAGELVVHAYVGLPIFGKTQLWQRVPASAATAAR